MTGSAIRSNPDSPRRVLLAIRMAGIPGRRKLAGVFRYLEESQAHWDIRFVRTREYFTRAFVRTLSRAGIDGVIASFPDAHEANAELERSCIPTVMLDPLDSSLFPKDSRGIAWLQSDSAAIGREAAAHLLAQGRFRSFGFVHDYDRSSWSEARAAAFSAAVGQCAVFSGKGLSPDRDFARLIAWIRDLPKPAGVMVAYDDRAILVMEACRQAGVSVPADVALVSCDNDELLCNHLSPGLTSIEADFPRVGYRAAEILAGMMSARKPPAATIETCGGVRLVARGSSAPVSSGGALVVRALAFIDANADSGIGVEDVVRHLKVSRRLADLRFREVRGMSIAAAIRARRIETVKDCLARTDDKIEAIAARTGFANEKHLMTCFRRATGCSMREWREKSRHDIWS